MDDFYTTHPADEALIDELTKENKDLLKKVSLLETRLIQVDMKRPFLAVDVVCFVKNEKRQNGLVLIERKWEPTGWALPGGHVDYGESCEDAAIREMKEEISLDIKLGPQIGTYSNPTRDPRKHTVSVVYVAWAEGTPVAADDAKAIMFVSAEGQGILQNLPPNLCFDHKQIIADAVAFLKI